MKRVLIDTSAMMALLVRGDRAHARAKRAFRGLRAAEAVLVTSSYVLVETHALLGRRMGLPAVRRFHEEFAPLLEVIWVGKELHEAGIALQLDRDWPTLSLVDAVSFVLFQRARLEQAFAFDRHFEREGLALVR